VSSSLFIVPPQSGSFLLVCIAVAAQEPLAACTVVAPSCATDRRPRLHPSSNRGSDTTVRILRGARGTIHIEARTPHKQERHHTLTQNLKAMGLWVLLLIRCSTFTLLSYVGHITHTCTQQHSPSSVGPSLYRAPSRAEAFYLLVSPLLHKSLLL